ncbi:NAD(P)/FAD-dependent oxidoreductase [Streptomyces malaysiensis]|uniref:NAD(P)/FAD-dependent oxidoreductase n=1 Tax=Streptomyces malaysiensis TaxID=92644 RepID=UPI002B2DA24E|nr:NAD(P)/FAD-dependent oxidoreductase [Streptomyces malaysiensis]
MSGLRRVVVVGGSIAGTTAATTLRELGFDGEITVIGDEPHAPYARPPLSKAILRGDEPPESTALAVTAEGIDWIRGTAATGLDIDAGLVRLEHGATVPYDGLVIATGGRARHLVEGADLEGVHVLRTLDDAAGLSRAFATRPRVVVVGGGYLGMEIASTALGLGLQVTVVDMAPPLVAQLGPFLADIMTGAAREHGLIVKTSPGGARLTGSRAVDGVLLADGRHVEADLVVTAVGCRPNTEWLRDSGIPLLPGVVVDSVCRVAPGIVAAGDVTASRRSAAGPPLRSPFWMNALTQGRVAATALLDPGAAQPAAETPYFWTEAFGLELKLAGRLPGQGVPQVIAGDLADLSVLLAWPRSDGTGIAAALNHRIPLSRLRRAAQLRPMEIA